jgi:hypothetical protein
MTSKLIIGAVGTETYLGEELFCEFLGIIAPHGAPFRGVPAECAQHTSSRYSVSVAFSNCKKWVWRPHLEQLQVIDNDAKSLPRGGRSGRRGSQRSGGVLDDDCAGRDAREALAVGHDIIDRVGGSSARVELYRVLQRAVEALR